jgi:Xaa-Pro aminopeptidase
MQRIQNIKKIMKERNIDVCLTHSCECESASVRYLSNFWPIFDFAGVIIPQEGDPILLTGGPESYEYAKQFSHIEDVRVHPLYVESNAPIWDIKTKTTDFSLIFKEIRENLDVRRVGVCNTNIIPYKIMHDLRRGAEQAEIVEVDDLFESILLIKSDQEVALLREAYRITEVALIQALERVKPGVAEWEIEAEWRRIIYSLGAEGTSYPVWVTSGTQTYQSLCRSTDRRIKADDFVQLTFGAKYNGYCGNMCRPVIVGNVPDRVERMLQVSLDAMNEMLSTIGPGVEAAVVYDQFRHRLTANGYQDFALYGPAHGTGLSECEGPWVDNRKGLILQPNMVLNLDIWISDGTFGSRFEDGILITQSGIEELTSYKREIIRI